MLLGRPTYSTDHSSTGAPEWGGSRGPAEIRLSDDGAKLTKLPAAACWSVLKLLASGSLTALLTYNTLTLN